MTDVRPEGLDELTDRQREIMYHVAHGRTDADVARLLVITHNTVKTHMRRILQLLDARNRTHALLILCRDDDFLSYVAPTPPGTIRRVVTFDVNDREYT